MKRERQRENEKRDRERERERAKMKRESEREIDAQAQIHTKEERERKTGVVSMNVGEKEGKDIMRRRKREEKCSPIQSCPCQPHISILDTFRSVLPNLYYQICITKSYYFRCLQFPVFSCRICRSNLLSVQDTLLASLCYFHLPLHPIVLSPSPSVYLSHSLSHSLTCSLVL